MSQQPNVEKSKKIQQVRKELGLTQTQFAALIPLDRSYLSQLEGGTVEIQQWIVERVESIKSEKGSPHDKFDVSPKDFKTLAQNAEQIDWNAVLGPIGNPPSRKELRSFALRLGIAQAAMNLNKVADEKDRLDMTDDIVKSAMELRDVMHGKEPYPELKEQI